MINPFLFMKMAQTNYIPFYLCNVNGTVKEILPPNKAVVTFTYNEREERALLPGNKLLIDARSIDSSKLYECITEGSKIKFSCHDLKDVGVERCHWIATKASLIPTETYEKSSTLRLVFGICNMRGYISKLTKRLGIITYRNASGQDEEVLFLANKVFINGNRIGSKLICGVHLKLYEFVMFDATPCIPNQNDGDCSWFATLVWKDHKPVTDYDSLVDVPISINCINLLGIIKQAVHDPKSMFVSGIGHIVCLLNEEYGVALISLRCNHWESLLIHRSVCFLFKMGLKSCDLREIFKEGDKIKFIAVPSPTQEMITMWLATQVCIHEGPQISPVIN